MDSFLKDPEISIDIIQEFLDLFFEVSIRANLG